MKIESVIKKLILYRKKLKTLHGHYKLQGEITEQSIYVGIMQEFDGKFPEIIEMIERET